MPVSESQYYSNVPMRTVPDIAMDADPNTGMIVGETQVFPDGTYWDQYRIGGTSLASPLLAWWRWPTRRTTRHSASSTRCTTA